MIKYYYAGSTRVAMRTGSSTLNYLLGDHSLVPRDRLGSNAITTNSSGVKSAELRYYPWGTERYTSGTIPTIPRTSGQAYHFTSEIMKTLQAGRDSRTGLGFISTTAAGMTNHWIIY